jgi:SAM-dependent methyltransferase
MSGSGEIDSFTSFIEGLQKGPDHIWRGSTLSQVSYPHTAHQDLADVEDRSFWFNHRKNCIVESANRFLKGGSLFDIGGGNGFMTLAFKNLGYDSILVEPGESGVQRAKSRGLTKIIQASFDDLKIMPLSLPHVGLFDVIEHVENDVEFLKRLNEKMSPKSRLLVTVPAYAFLWSPEDEFAGHFRRYKLSDLKSTLHKAGFEVDYSSYFFSFLVLPLFFVRTLGKYFKKNQSRPEDDHLVNEGLKRNIISSLLNWELSRIRKNKTIPFGTSCIVVARKAK